jgi:hypothetical protein
MGEVLHDSKGEHACESHTLTKGDLYFGEVLRGPEKDDEIAQSILCRMEVVDRLNVETLCCHEVLEDIPICAGRSAPYSQHTLAERCDLEPYEHWNRVTKKQAVFKETV